MERHLLVVFPHPDDETFACGGTIASHAAAGTPVTYLCATRGEMGRRMGKPAFATRESLPLLREQELRQACAALGIADLRLLGICDKTVEFLDPAALAARIGAVIDEVRPSLVLTFHPVHGGHPDHCAVGAATVQAVAARPRAGRPKLLCPLSLQQARKLWQGEPLGVPYETVGVAHVAERKRAAIAAHRSQSEGMAEDMARDPMIREWLTRRFAEEHFVVYPV